MNRQSIAEQEDLIKESLFNFVRKHIPDAQPSSIDEIVLSYCVSILEELGESNGQDDFDVEGFCEMMSAFLPEFSKLPHAAVATWMFELEASLREQQKGESPSVSPKELTELLLPLNIEARSPQTPRTPRTSESSLNGSDPLPKRTHQLSETSDGSSDGSIEFTGFEDTVCILQEMFPQACLAEVQHCLAVAEGDPGRAAQLVLHRQEAGQSILPSAAVLQPSNLRQKTVVNDDEMKSRIIAKYSYVDRDDDAREHRPIAPKSEPKKMVRYRDNKIVSLKGERYTEVKREDADEPTPPKKTVVNLKPARQFRFH